MNCNLKENEDTPDYSFDKFVKMSQDLGDDVNRIVKGGKDQEDKLDQDKEDKEEKDKEEKDAKVQVDDKDDEVKSAWSNFKDIKDKSTLDSKPKDKPVLDSKPKDKDKSDSNWDKFKDKKATV